MERRQVVPLAPKAHDVLVTLVRRAGTLVTTRELLDLAWRDVAVAEGVLSVYVSALRRCVGDSVEPGCIETVPRAGYRFAAAVRWRTVAAEPLSMTWPTGVLPARPDVSELIGGGRSCLRAASRSEIPRAVEAFRTAFGLIPTTRRRTPACPQPIARRPASRCAGCRIPSPKCRRY